MYAVIASGGKQYRVRKGQQLALEKLSAEVGQVVAIDKVLMKADEQGEVTLGQPYVEGATVEVEVVDQCRGKKINIIKFKRRKHHMKRMGHRQYITKVKVVDIKG